ncbi:hypothetical protein ACOKFD_04720 [Flagellimonas sp. S174]|uniref:hypothetical protein n=1 Tax=Flagellimonas sp. S174 TaxID=3410790 RepID=UPI003BF568D0
MNLKQFFFYTLTIIILLTSCSKQESEADEFTNLQGTYCWDLNGNGLADIESEDLNNDGKVDKFDCRDWEPKK